MMDVYQWMCGCVDVYQSLTHLLHACIGRWVGAWLMIVSVRARVGLQRPLAGASYSAAEQCGSILHK
jgi:hypothetical protein